MSSADSTDEARAPGLWAPAAPGKLIGRGHSAGDLLEAFEWDVLERRDGVLRVLAHLPAHLKNPRGQLFGGFTPTYVDLVALHTFWAGREPRPGNPWLATLNMRVDYFAPIVAGRFEISSRVVHRTASICSVETRFLGPADPEGRSGEPEPGDAPTRPLLAYAYTTLKAV